MIYFLLTAPSRRRPGVDSVGTWSCTVLDVSDSLSTILLASLLYPQPLHSLPVRANSQIPPFKSLN